VGVHAFRWIEHIAGQPVARIDAATTTSLGATIAGRPSQAASVLMTLANNGLATLTANYLNPRGFPGWGNESLRVFGTDGMAEITDGGARSRWYNHQGDQGPVPVGETPDYFFLLMRHFATGEPMPLSLEDELHATRAALRASAMAKTKGGAHAL
jgi:predicted dehydrogenase